MHTVFSHFLPPMTSFFHGATAEPPSEPFPFSSSFLYVTFPPTDSLIPPPMIALPRIHPREREKSSPGSEEGRREVFFPGILGATVSHYSRSLLEAPPIFISVAPIPQQKNAVHIALVVAPPSLLLSPRQIPPTMHGERWRAAHSSSSRKDG